MLSFWCELIKHARHLVSFTPHVKISLIELMNHFRPLCLSVYQPQTGNRRTIRELCMSLIGCVHGR